VVKLNHEDTKSTKATRLKATSCRGSEEQGNLHCSRGRCDQKWNFEARP
jgi:hypothetical protein